jgi:hypothetical protein
MTTATLITAAPEYVARFGYGDRVCLVRTDAEAGRYGTVMFVLANPSGLAKNQWYDVRFDDRAFVRVPERDLADGKRAAKHG